MVRGPGGRYLRHGAGERIAVRGKPREGGGLCEWAARCFRHPETSPNKVSANRVTELERRAVAQQLRLDSFAGGS